MSDPRIQTQAEADLLERIANEIVEPEVMEPMSRIGWQHGTPPAPLPFPNPADNPQAPTPVTPAPETAKVESKVDNPLPQTASPVAKPTDTPSSTGIDWESLRGKNGLILDKYTDEAQAVKGVAHAVNMAKQALNRATTVEEENSRLRAELDTVRRAPVIPAAPVTPTVLPTPEPPKTDLLDSVLKQIVDEGGTIDERNVTALRSALAETAKTIAQDTVKQTLAEQNAVVTKEQEEWLKVDTYMRQNHPDSLNFVDEIQVFVQTTPVVSAAVNALIKEGKRQQASELAWTTFKASVDAGQVTTAKTEALKKEVTLAAGDQVRREAVEAARKDAGVQTSLVQGVHETPGAVGYSQEEIDAAAAEMRQTGLGDRWRAMTIGKDLTGPLFDNL